MRAQNRLGKIGQEYAAAALRRAGVSMVEQIATPVQLIPARQPGTYRVFWSERVSGDHRGIIEGAGTSVLAETKTVLDRNLQYSDLREHQPDRLTMHAKLGGISVLIWIHRTGIFIIPWPIAGFEPGKSISPARAEQLSTNTIASDAARRAPKKSKNSRRAKP